MIGDTTRNLTGLGLMDMEAPRPGQEEISFNELAQVLIRSKWLILAITAFFTAAAVLLFLIFPKSYEATVVISAVSSDSQNGLMGGMSSAASQFSGLASLVGIAPQQDSKKSESLAVLQSEALTQQYIADNDLLPVLYSNRWDAVAKRWKVTDPKKIPTLWTANQLFKERIRVLTTDTKTGLSTLVITWKDPVVAARWANGLVKMTNDYLRAKTIHETELNIAYLTEQAAKTDAIGVRQAVYSILQSEISKAMLAKGSDEYALKVVDPAFAPEKPSSPKLALWMFVGAIIGLIISFIIVMLRSPLPKR